MSEVNGLRGGSSWNAPEVLAVGLIAGAVVAAAAALAALYRYDQHLLATREGCQQQGYTDAIRAGGRVYCARVEHGSIVIKRVGP